ncbi:hypothetical protein DFJ58DRAFT_704196 [Suillus subalutaceus]|uniref:uncharacterized protein n=1 Tax=Suillus subalutaceus TaxID=48586 RepID=UPI001B87E7C3|nr:uncharacterized protein DFJ58DRAFT_704196 [Suillus subalutaceus]KAG1851296.1 hypothetical protein DFJ58DRAFT_704196 [Suillus subalutaceus]
MAHPALWRGKTFFYPIGNTSAVCLTQDLCPSEKADVLLLGCGDPRHILYTVYTNSTGSQASRKLDFTCCDLESAVIARNVILFTLLADEGAVQKVPQIWNIFFHFYLDKASHDLLISQCRKLVELSSDLDSWNNSPYGHFLRMCTRDTLAELRRLWQLYVKTTTFSPGEAKAFESAYTADVKASKAKFESVCTSSRAAGPLSMYAFEMAGDHYNIYWETGICSAVPKRPSEVSYPNSTLAYSMVGDKFGVHYGTDPLSCFHLAEALAPAVGSARHPEQVTLKDIVNVCKTQFSRWCTSVSMVLGSQGPSSPSPLIIRYFVGDALSFCQALGYFRTTKSTSTPFLVAPWKSACIAFDPEAYGTDTQSLAPTTFNIIDTSNLLDHVGVLNILVVIFPILQRTPSATLYTEGLAGSSLEETLPQQLCGDIATIGLLLGLIPVCFVSQFTNRSNMHEHIMRLSQSPTQNHERLAWKLIGGAEKLLTDLDCPINIAAEQLAGIFFNIYLNMFSHENMARKLAMVQQSPESNMLSGIIHYHRRSFVEVLGVVKRRVITDWDSTMNMLHGKIQKDRTLITGMNFYQDLCCQLHLLGVFDVDWLSLQKVREVHRVERPFVFRDWKTLPQIVCVVLVIPRARLQPLLPTLDEAGTPVLQCDVRGVTTSNAFSCINTVFGTVKISGKGDGKTAAIEEDATRRYGTSPLVVWFWVPYMVLLDDHRLSVVLSVLSTPATCMLAMKLGLDLSLFRADIGDEKLVHILRQRPNAVPESPEDKSMQTSDRPMKAPGATFVTLDKECKKPLSFTTRVDIVEPKMKASLTSGATPTVNQVSMHSIAIVLGDKSLQFPFPLPVDAKKAKLRIARKSLYIEVTLPPKLALGETDTDMFPIIPQGGDLTLWNMHRVNLDQCVPFSITNKKALGWINPHLSFMFSERERRIPQGLITGSTLLDVKHTLNFIFGLASGTADGKPPLCYALQEEHAIFVMIYITDLRLDLGSHTMVADAWVMPSSPEPAKIKAFGKVSQHLMAGTDMKQTGIAAEERKAWMHLLVAATERCRTWEHKTNCEYRAKGAIPLTLEPDWSPICSCGAGVGAEAFVKKYPMLRPLAPYVTRAVISPLFALSYMERVGAPEDAIATKTPLTPASAAAVRHVCAACGKEGSAPGSLSICSRCKIVRYCSADCQREDWKGHKKRCIVPSS